MRCARATALKHLAYTKNAPLKAGTPFTPPLCIAYLYACLTYLARAAAVRASLPRAATCPLIFKAAKRACTHCPFLALRVNSRSSSRKKAHTHARREPALCAILHASSARRTRPPAPRAAAAEAPTSEERPPECDSRLPTLTAIRIAAYLREATRLTRGQHLPPHAA